MVEIGEHLSAALAPLAERYPAVIESVRGAGLMIGIKCVAPAGDIVTALRGNGLLTVPAADNVVRLLPPLIIDEKHVAEAVAAIDKTCREYGA